MNANDVQTLLAMETVEPNRRLVRSSGALYTVLLLLVFGAMAAANALNTRFEIPRMAAEMPLYALIALYGWYAHEFDLTSYRYTLTDRVFAVERIVGGRERGGAAVELADILEIMPATDVRMERTRKERWSARPARESIALRIKSDDGERIWRISPGAEFLEQLTAQQAIAAARRDEE